MKQHLSFFALLFVAVGAIASSKVPDEPSFYARLARSLESFGAVFREVNTSYVDEVDPQDLVEVGIGAMLKHLDPYSTYMKEDETDELDMLSTGSYVGFGISVGRRDSLLTIIDILQNGPAMKNGIRIGDRLISIDNVRTDTMAPQSIRPYTKGSPGSIAHVRITRDGRRDTISIDVKREELQIESIGHMEILPNSIGYVRLARFSRGTGLALRRALRKLQDQAQLSGLILDLRNNPGGLLDAAVDVAELFVPRSSVIVTTKSRYDSDRQSYASNEDPVEPTLPLAVIINERSASASEIVAGAIQDLDRGIIIGKRSFGKGLVQTMVPLPNDATLKLTTSRYFTPSGRCIQRINYRSHRAPSLATTTALAGLDTVQKLFETSNGRKVAELHGIDPDSSVIDSVMPAALAYLDAQNVFSSFASIYASGLDALPPNFAVGKVLVDQFLAYVDSLPASKRSVLLSDIATARLKAVSGGWPELSLKGLELAEKSLEKEVGRIIRMYQPILVERLEQEIRTCFGTDAVRESRALRTDRSVISAREILLSPRYQLILSSQVPSDQ